MLLKITNATDSLVKSLRAASLGSVEIHDERDEEHPEDGGMVVVCWSGERPAVLATVERVVKSQPTRHEIHDETR